MSDAKRLARLTRKVNITTWVVAITIVLFTVANVVGFLVMRSTVDDIMKDFDDFGKTKVAEFEAFGEAQLAEAEGEVAKIYVKANEVAVDAEALLQEVTSIVENLECLDGIEKDLMRTRENWKQTGPVDTSLPLPEEIPDDTPSPELEDVTGCGDPTNYINYWMATMDDTPPADEESAEERPKMNDTPPLEWVQGVKTTVTH